MAKGSWSATDESSVIIPASGSRGDLTIQMYSGGDPVYLGFGEPAVVGKGLQISASLPVLKIESSHLSYGAIYGICATGKTSSGGYQEA